MRNIIIFALSLLPTLIYAQTGSINGVTGQILGLPLPTATTLGGIQSIALTTNNWVQYIDTNGAPHIAQVAFSNLNGSLACNQTPALTGDVTTSAGSCGTIVNKIGGITATIGGPFTMSGAYTFNGLLTGNTSITYPTSGTLAILGLNTFTRTQTDAVNTVSSGSTPAFDLSLGNVQYIAALSTNAIPSFSNITTGSRWRFIICNNSSGNFTWTWPASVHGGATIGTTASKCTVQAFTSPDGSNLYAETVAVINQ